jgi:phage terminase large subunit-like protein
MSGNSIAGILADALESDYRVRARPSQLPPLWNWLVWLILTGRGWGKTWCASSWINELAMTSVCRIALIGATAPDVRDIMVEGETGVLRTAPAWCRPTYEPSKRKIEWPNGSVAHAFSAEEPDRLRGPQFHYGWLDELAAFPNDEEVWNMFQFGLRLGQQPRCIITTTPRPKKLIRSLLSRKDVAVVRGSTFENSANLAPGFLEAVTARYGGTRLGRQELEGEVLLDTPGALWQLDWLDRDRVAEAPKVLRRIVVSVDPAVSNNEGSDETGIIVAGIAENGHGYILEDLSGRYAPHEWAAKTVAAFRRHKADRVVIEANQGGLMAQETLRVQDRNLPIKAVHASRGKVTRAEPIAGLYEQRRVHHVGTFPQLEDQLVMFTSDFDRGSAGFSPDRLDALVWGLSELMPMTAVQHIPMTMPFYSGVPRSFPCSDSSWASGPPGRWPAGRGNF